MDTEHATKIIAPLETDLVNYVRLKLREKIERGAKPMFKYRGADAYSFGDDQTGYIVLYHGGSVVYFVRYKRIRHNGFRLGRQVLLWRDADADLVTGGFAREVFFRRLLPKFTALIADKEQTRNGAAFWSNAIGSAFDRGLYVYLLDRRSRKTQLTPLLTPEDVETHSSVLWGKTPAHLLTFAVISEKPLTLKAKS
jgi:hypothetical protein